MKILLPKEKMKNNANFLIKKKISLYSFPTRKKKPKIVSFFNKKLTFLFKKL